MFSVARRVPSTGARKKGGISKSGESSSHGFKDSGDEGFVCIVEINGCGMGRVRRERTLSANRAKKKAVKRIGP